MNISKNDLNKFIANLEQGLDFMEKFGDVIDFGNRQEMAELAILDANQGITTGYPIELVEYAPAHREYMSA